MTLEISGLRKAFGEVQALDGVSFAVAPGEVFGFLGANGAGKTTTMRIVLGLMRADEGTVTWQGARHARWPRRTWGYMPEERGLYLRMPVLEQLVHIAALYGVPRKPCARGGARPGWSGSGSRMSAPRRLDTLSKGNQQKVQYIATILHDPDVLLMDEPFVGLDPVNVAMLKAAFLEMRDRGKTLVFSTHQLETAEALCDSVAIIDHGRILASGTTREVRRSTGHQAVRLATARRRRHRLAGRRCPGSRSSATSTTTPSSAWPAAPTRRRSSARPSAAARRCSGSRWRTRRSRTCSWSASAPRWPTTSGPWRPRGAGDEHLVEHR